MAIIYIDDIPHEVDPNKNLLEVCLSLGYDLPYFCWHPAMGSVGACRQCAVIKYKDENDHQGKLFMACMEPAADGTRLSLKHPEAENFRRQIIEWLMINHPHDCPVCDEGGECHLQDMTVMAGHNYRRYKFKKRTYPNQYLGPLINHEMNRCIQCYRCVRFYQDYADGRDLDVFAAHDHVYFGRHKDGVLENEFSGNLVEVCPTGVFTDKTLKSHYTRKWDLTSAPSICSHCGVGCNIIAGERYGSLRRILSRFNSEVNGYFICDRGRFGYEHVNSNKRIRGPFVKSYDEKVYMDPEEVEKQVREYIAPDKTVVGIGSPRTSLEANAALKNLVGRDNFYVGISNKELSSLKKVQKILNEGPVKTPSLKETEHADAIFILGEDLTNTAPRMALSVRQAARHRPHQKALDHGIPLWHDAAVRKLVQNEQSPIFIATPAPTKLDDIATETCHEASDNMARLGFAIAKIIDPQAPDAKLPEQQKILAHTIAKKLKQADNPLIISGTSLQNEALIEAAFNIAAALNTGKQDPMLSFVVPECNSMGLAMMSDYALEDIIKAQDNIDTLIVLENDLYRRKNKDFAEELINMADNIIVMDHLENDSVAQADLTLPVGTFAETDGTYINNEGRAQRFYQVYEPFGEIKESWRWLAKFKHGFDVQTHFQEQLHNLVQSHPQFEQVLHLTPLSDFRKAGQKIPRQSHRYSGRTAMHAHVNVSEPQPPQDQDSPLSFTMEGYRGEPPSSVIPYFWSPGWNSAQAINKYQIEVGGSLHDGDPGIRLFEPHENNTLAYFNNIPEYHGSKNGGLIAEPAYHIFGSEELSIHAPGIAALSPSSYLGLNAKDANKLNIKANETVTITIDDTNITTKIQLIRGLAEGVALIPSGIDNIPVVTHNKWLKIQKS